ncbi:MAG: OmpA family protein [Parvibaculaceae bacterium]
MKKAVILAAALALWAPSAVFAQEQDPNDVPVVIPDQGAGSQGDEQPVKKRKKKERAQQQESVSQGGDEAGQPARKRKKREQAEEPQDSSPAQTVDEQPRKKKKKQRAEQPEEPTQAPADEQAEQPVKTRKKKERAEQPQDATSPPAEEQAEQPVEKRKKKEQAAQPGDRTQPAEVTRYLSDTRSVKELSDEELAQRAKAGADLSRVKGLSDDTRRKLAAEGRKARAEALARQQGKAGKSDQDETTAGRTETGEVTKSDEEAGRPAANPDKQDVQQLDGNKASPEAEARAKAYLDDTHSPDQLKEDELRDRVEGMRALMAGNKLSRQSERALRRKLSAERGILRDRVARKVAVEEKRTDERPGKQGRSDRDERKWDNWAARDVLRDRRRSEDLEEGELRRRIDIYRVAVDDERYDAKERAYWRDMMERDRRYLRDRMVGDRRERARYWRGRRDRNDLNIDINIDLGAGREPREAVFMDEIDDEELEDYMVAAPLRKISRRYTVEEIEEEPEVRTAMPAIEVDNIHFGFNESFVREEEVENLDRIAEVIEKILAAHPGEVFMIEGHTDAVGSDDYNLKLSRERAEAVKKALTTYYVIPPRNLEAAGYGERYLKIPTSDAEEENRRVSLRRVTPLVGEVDAAEAE